MVSFDYIAIIVVLAAIVLGSLFGFGKLLKFFTGGIIGFLISVVVTYFFIGVVASWGFVQDIMAKIVGAMQNANNGFVNFLLKIGIERVILGVMLFIAVQILRILIVNIIKGIMEIDNPVLRVINRVGGALLMLAVVVMLTLLAFHIIALIGGGSEESVKQALSGSVFKFDWVYEHNPLQYIIKQAVPAE